MPEVVAVHARGALAARAAAPVRAAFAYQPIWALAVGHAPAATALLALGDADVIPGGLAAIGVHGAGAFLADATAAAR